jgi:excisionase family DNA binding protein
MSTVNGDFFPYLTPAGAAKTIGSSRNWIYTRIRRGELQASKVGGSIFVHRDDLRAMVENAPKYIETAAA